MTFEGWSNTSEHFFDLLGHIEIHSLPEWSEWEKQINEVLDDMAFEDAMGCSLDDLISLAGLNGEIEVAMKQHIMNKRIENAKEDFV